MNLGSVIQSEVSQKEVKQRSYIDAYVWNLEKWYTDEPICRAGLEMQM